MGLWKHIRALGRRDVAGVLVPCLLISTVLWYFIKLSYTYTAEIPVDVVVDGQHIRVQCVVESTGYRLVAHRYLLSNDIELSLSDIEAAPSVVNKNSYVLDPFSLQHIISERNSDLRVISVGEIPEIVIKDEE
jgi:hypothetical protein